MSDRTYVEKLRDIRDQIAQELQHTPWELWDKQAREEVQRYPKLARLLDEATRPASTEPSVPE